METKKVLFIDGNMNFMIYEKDGIWYLQTPIRKKEKDYGA